MSIDKLSKALFKKERMILALPLGRSIRLGSIGYLEAGRWVEVTTVKKMFGFSLKEMPGIPGNTSFDLTSGRDVSFRVFADGEPSGLIRDVALAKARAELSFGRAGAFILNVKSPSFRAAGELGNLVTAIRRAYHNRKILPQHKRWNKRYAVITGVASAGSVVAVVAMRGRTSMAVSGAGSIGPPESIPSLDAKMTVIRESRSTAKLWARPATGWAYVPMRLHTSMFGIWDHEYLVHTRTPTGRRLLRRGIDIPLASSPDSATVELLGPGGRAVTTASLRTIRASWRH